MSPVKAMSDQKHFEAAELKRKEDAEKAKGKKRLTQKGYAGS